VRLAARSIALPSSESSKARTQFSWTITSKPGSATALPSSGRRQWPHGRAGRPGFFPRQAGHVTSSQLEATRWFRRAPPHSVVFALWTRWGKR
jgi:hypothetical protein